MADIFGTDGDDFINGTAEADLIRGLGGHDLINGQAGDDVIHGDEGDDQLRGNGGNDQLYGGDGGDLLRGGAGIDYFDGGSDSGIGLTGGHGDRISFFEVNATQGVVADLRTGIISNDGFGNMETMVGIESLGGDTAFADTFYGNDGINALLASRGDTMMGFGGDDSFQSSGAAALVDGGDGTDSLLLTTLGYLLPDSNGDGLAENGPAMTSGWIVDLSSGFVQDGFGDTGFVTGVENVGGTQYADTLVGDAADNALGGGGGDDVLIGLGGNDTLEGHEGHDYLEGNDGNDLLHGGQDDDYLYGNAGDDLIDGGDGFDRAGYSNGATAGVTVDLNLQGTAQDTGQGFDTLVGIENVSGTRFSDVITGDAGDNWLWGGSDGSGVTGDDVISAGDGNDLVTVGAGNHTLDGGAGNDTLSLYGNASDISPSGVTFSLALQGSAQDSEQGVMAAIGFENLVGSIHADTLTGDSGDNVLAGVDGDDLLVGGAGNDTLYGDGIINIDSHGTGRSGPIVTTADTGAAGNDTLEGGEGDDHLDGGAGNDVLDGGAGNDFMVGGTGDDVYFVQPGDAVIENEGEGTDEIRTSDHWGLEGSNVENLTAIGSGDIFLGGNEADNVITGNDGDNYLVGRGGNDTLDGGDGRDVAAFHLPAGTIGNLRVVESGATFLVQLVQDDGSFEDLFAVDPTEQGSATVTGLNSMAYLGTDTVTNVEDLHFFVDSFPAPTPEGQFVNIMLAPYVPQSPDFLHVSGSAADDVIDLATLYPDVEPGTPVNASGGYGNDTIYGTEDGNYIEGNQDNDLLDGRGGNDSLNGDAGDDTLQGGDGDDYIVGGSGNDVIDGGTGTNDVASFQLPEGTPGAISVVDGTGDDAGKLLVQISDGGVTQTFLRVTVTGQGSAIVEGVGIGAFMGTDTVNNADELHIFVNNPGGILPGQFAGISLTPRQFGDFVAGSEASDTIDLATYAGAINANGNRGDDVIVGTAAINNLFGGAGNDTLSGEGGNDFLNGQGGDDTLNGGLDNDTLIGAAGSDTLNGGDGDDTLIGAFHTGFGGQPGDGADILRGDGGNDLIRGGDGDDLLEGGDGNDNLRGDAGSDTLDGGAGEDFVSYVFTPLDGGITFDARAVTSNSTIADPLGGTDTLIDIDGIGISGTNFDDILYGSEHLAPTLLWANQMSGNGGNDQMFGASHDDFLDGGTGDDTLQAGAGNDLLIGGEGNDVLIGGPGTDELLGGAGDDFILAGSGNNFVDGGEGNDAEAFYFPPFLVGTFSVVAGSGADSGKLIVMFDDGSTIQAIATVSAASSTVTVTGVGLGSFLGTTTINSVERLLFSTLPADVASDPTAPGYVVIDVADAFELGSVTGGSRSDVILGSDADETLVGGNGSDLISGDGGNDIVIGGEDDDVLLGGSDDDTLDGGAGNDVLDGGAGNDVLDGGSGSDLMVGGTGDDVYLVQPDDGIIENEGEGTDEIRTADHWGLEGTNVENLTALGNADTFLGGSAVDNVLTGNAGNNYMIGNGGNDQIVGGDGRDTSAYHLPAGTTGSLRVAEAADGSLLVQLVQADGSFEDVFSVVVSGAGSATVTGLGLAAHLGTDTVTSIEDLHFMVDTSPEPTPQDQFAFISLSITQFDTYVAGSAGDDVIDLADYPGASNVGGAFGDDVITGAAGNQDYMRGDQGDDVITGNGGSDFDVAAFGLPAPISGTLRVVAGTGENVGNLLVERVDGETVETLFIVSFDESGTATVQGVNSAAFLGTDTVSGVGAIDFTVDNPEWNPAQFAHILMPGDPGAGDDFIFGTGESDLIAAGAGDDQIRGNDGDDVLLGGDGNDLLRGGAGVDYFDGGADYPEDSPVIGTFGDRISFFELRATQGVVADLRTGIIANDGFGNVEAMVGIEGLGGDTAFVDSFYGNDNSNWLFGSRGDNLFGFGGDDFFQTSAGTAVVDGGDGHDTLYLNAFGGWLTPDTNGDGFAESVAPATDGFFVNLAGGFLVDGYGNSGAITGVEAVFGSHLEDILFGGSANDHLDGGAGDDSVRGQGGDDQLYGGDGNDLIRGGAGVDYFDGGADDGASPFGGHGDRISFFEVTATQGVIADLRTGIVSNDGFGNVEMMVGIESLGGDTAFADAFYGNDGANTLLGSVGDTLSGFGGDDSFQSSGAAALVDGGDGTDFLQLSTLGYLLPDSNGDGLAETAADMTSGWIVDLSTGYVEDGFGDTGFVTGVENVGGTEYGDTLVGNFADNELSGGGGGDLLIGLGGNDLLEGGLGHDYLEGNVGNDSLHGGDDDDYLYGNAGDDLIDGGNGFDRAGYSAGATAGVTVDLNLQGVAQDTGQGFDTLVGIEHVSGTRFSDVITGDAGDNWLWGGSDGSGITGDDIISAGDGNDLVTVGAGNHTLDGGAGIDTLSLYGNASDISPSGVTFSLALQGSVQDSEQGHMAAIGFENLVGSIHADQLTGDSGDNVLAGVEGDDLLVGGAGNDTLYGDGIVNIDSHGTGRSGPIVTTADTGAAGNDVLEGGEGDDHLDGGAGSDTASYASASGGVTVDLFWQAAFGAAGNDSMVSIENAIGSGFNDVLLGDGDGNAFSGGAGHDYLLGGDGNDSLLGGDDDDYLIGGSGDDVLDGGEGIDRAGYSSGATTGVTVDLNLQGVAQNTGRGMDVLIGIEHVSGTRFDDVITGDGGDNWLWGGSDGSGVTGNDIISAGAGDDLVDVGTGNHVLDGGNGTDTLSLDGNGTDITAAGVTLSLQLQGAAQDSEQGMMNLSGFENLSGSLFDDQLTGDGGDNVLAGYAGADTLVGGAGNDVLLGDGIITVDTHGTGNSGPIVTIADTGAAGNDTLQGGEGDDTLIGGAGDDLIDGGTGNADAALFDLPAAGAGSLSIVDGTGERAGMKLVVLTDGDSSTTLATISIVDGIATVTGMAGAALLGTDTITNVDKLVFTTQDEISVELSIGSGVVADGLVAGATVFMDANDNGILDEGEAFTTTNSDGSFSFLSAGSGAVIAYGGTNVDTGLPNLITMTAPEGSSVVNPITTLIAAVLGSGNASSPEEAAQIVASAFGIDGSIDLLNLDLVTAAADGNQAALDAQKIAVQVVTIIATAADASGSDSAGVVLANLASLALETPEGETLDLADTATLTDALGGTVSPESIETIVNGLSGTLEQIDNAESLDELSETQAQALTTGNDLDNVIVGGTQDDELSGLGGNDVLTGGSGADQLHGGTGADHFVFLALGDSSNIASDLVLDFSGRITMTTNSKGKPIKGTGEGDKIDLSAIDANINLDGDQAFTLVDRGFSGVAGEMFASYDKTAGRTSLYLDVDGDAVADMTIDFAGQVPLTGADFIF